MAAGLIELLLEDTQLTHVADIAGDPVKMWTKLQEVHAKQKPGNRLSAYAELFYSSKQPDESLQAYLSRLQTVRNRLATLRPASFDIKALEDELLLFAAVRGLSAEHEILRQNLLFSGSSLSLSTLTEAFVSKDTEEEQVTSALLTRTASPARKLAAAAAPAKKYYVYHRVDSHDTRDCKTLKKLADGRQSELCFPFLPSHGSQMHA